MTWSRGCIQMDGAIRWIECRKQGWKADTSKTLNVQRRIREFNLKIMNFIPDINLMQVVNRLVRNGVFLAVRTNAIIH